MTLTMVDPWQVEDGQIIRPIPACPGSDGVIIAHDIDAHGDETFLLGDGRTYRVRYGIPVPVEVTRDVPAYKIAVGDLVVWHVQLVRVVHVTRTLGALAIRWESERRRPDCSPAFTGITTVLPEELDRVRIRLAHRPASGEAWK